MIRSLVATLATILCLSLASCGGASAGSSHGQLSRLSEAAATEPKCAHAVPASVCTRCHAELVPRFKAAKDWCGEHDRPESQCLLCHPDLDFRPLPDPGADADLEHSVRAGEEVADLASLSVPGKVTIVDFWAPWCAPCREVDRHLFTLLRHRRDLAVRKLNVVDWESPLARHHLQGVPSLPYVVVFGPDGARRGAMGGLDLAALDRMLGGAQ